MQPNQQTQTKINNQDKSTTIHTSYTKASSKHKIIKTPVYKSNKQSKRKTPKQNPNPNCKHQ